MVFNHTDFDNIVHLSISQYMHALTQTHDLREQEFSELFIYDMLLEVLFHHLALSGALYFAAS